MTGYIGVNNLSKKISSMYIGVNNLSKKVNKAYIGVNSLSKLWYTSEFPEGPNDQYESRSLGTWSKASNVNTFFNTYKPDNGWSGLKLGNYVKIGDNTFTIAGFNMEHNQTAADGSVYDNGYGICMLGDTCSYIWGDDESTYFTIPYYRSNIHADLNSTTGTLYKSMKNIVGSHLVNRNVLLSSSVNYSTYRADGYTWTTAYYTTYSVGQCTGTFASHTNKYDDGEANYKLPLFNYEDYRIGSGSFGFYHTFRNIYGLGNENVGYAYGMTTSGINHSVRMDSSCKVRPLMYLR